MRLAPFFIMIAALIPATALAQDVKENSSVLRAECRSQAIARYDPGDVGRPLTWRRRVGEAYTMNFSADDAGRFVGQALHIPANGEAVQYSSSFDWREASVFINDPDAGFPHLLIRLVNAGSGPVYDALALKPARSGPQIIRYSCSFTCNDRPLKNLLEEACPLIAPN
ncbi:MAG: hypothetical protein JKY99_11525 [Rhizobiales bacterium]|nr:hypothetical protein [Hyphomicrobiales bacterium]